MRAGMVLWAAAAALAWLTGPAAAAESFKVGVIQQRTVFEKTKSGKRAMETMKEFTSSRQRIIAADEEEIKKLEGELKSQESGLSESAKAEKQEQLRVKFENYQQRIQSFGREIQQRQKELVDEFQKKLDESVQAVAEKNGFNAVIDAEPIVDTIQVVLYARPSINLTDQVVKEFDRRNK